MSQAQPNAQYNYADPAALSVRVATMVRREMFQIFMQALQPRAEDTVLDVGVTGDRTYESSNYFEALYPHKDRIVAAGLDDASFLESLYPGLRFQRANILSLPFADGSFDIVHSSAVWEHVGALENQAKMLSECFRVARRGIFLTTPNRWFPIEFHTQLPLVHWLPKRNFRALLKRTKYAELADEANLNLMTAGEVRRLAAAHPEWRGRVLHARLLGWPSNILFVAERAAQPAS